MERVAIIILNWNNANDTLACLGSVMAVDYPAIEVTVVDNGSSDDSVARIRAGFPQVRLLETGSNLGYAGGNNFGIRQVLTEGIEFICILNNDTTVEPDFLVPLLTVLQQRSTGVVTPLVAEHESVWALGLKVNRRTSVVSREHAGEPLAVWRGRPAFEVEVASGAAMLVKRTVYERAGLMDERFFLYFEEADWCLHLKRLGFPIFAVPESVVHHKVSATLGQASPLVDYYMTRNNLFFVRRHWTGFHRRLLCWSTVARQLLAIGAFTVKPQGGRRIPRRDARLYAAA